MKLLHISDLHYRGRYEYGNGASSYKAFFQNMTPPLELLDRCLQLLGDEEKAQLDGVLISGDLTENGTADDYRILRGELERRFPGIPLLVTLGNHDEKSAFREGWLGQAPDESPWCYTARIGDISFLVLDNSEPGCPNGMIDSRRCDWLRQAAREESGRNLVIMMHHHLLPGQAAFPSCPVDPAFSAILEELPVAAIICGHTHRHFRAEYAGIPYRTGASISFVGTDIDDYVCMKEAAGFSVYTMESGVITAERHETLELDKLLGYVYF